MHNVNRQREQVRLQTALTVSVSAVEGTTVTAASTLRTSLVGSTYAPPAAVSCLCRDTAVRCSVVAPFLWPARRPATRYQTTFEIRRVLLTVFVVTWKLFFSRSTSVHSALGASRLCGIQIHYWHWHWHWQSAKSYVTGQFIADCSSQVTNHQVWQRIVDDRRRVDSRTQTD